MTSSRRSFLFQAAAAMRPSAKELSCDVAVIGGSVGGCAAALAAARNGMKVILTEETEWIGGQLTSQAVPPDEHQWIETHGCTRAYRAYRAAVRDYYRKHYPLTPEAAARPNLNPGDGSVSRLTHEPRVSLAVLRDMLQRVTILTREKPVAVDFDGDRIRGVKLSGGTVIVAKQFIDATEMGDLLPLAKVEYVTGAESHRDTGELHASGSARPGNMQAFTWCFAVEYCEGEDHTIDKPAEYAFWRDYVPKLIPAWPGKLLNWTMTHPVTLEPRPMSFDPTLTKKGPGTNLWLYRRIANKQNFKPGTYKGDITLVNWPQNDYWLGNLFEVSEEEARRHWNRGKQLSLSLLYWMQTDQGWKGLKLRKDLVGTDDGLAMYPYIRESRRIRAEFTVLEEHVGAEQRKTKEAGQFPDSVGVGSYRIDLHPSSGGDNYIDVASLPFQIPMGALIPRRIENLLAGCKNIGTTHITNGCYRLHPVEWNIGESAGALAAYAVKKSSTPRAIRANSLADFQKWIGDQGIEIAWPKK